MRVYDLLSKIERRRSSLDAWLSDQCQSAVSQQQHLSSGSVGRAYWHMGYKAALDDILSHLGEHGETDERDNALAIDADRDAATKPGQPSENRVRFLVCAAHFAGRSADERTRWENVAQRVNELEIERVLPASLHGPDADHGLNDDQSVARSVFSFDDISWELADWMLRVYEDDGLSEFMSSNARELHQAFHQQDYQTDDVDHYSMFLSVYLGCYRTRSIWTETPVAAKAFEDWLTSMDSTLLERLGTLRHIGRTWSLASAECRELPPRGGSIH